MKYVTILLVLLLGILLSCSDDTEDPFTPSISVSGTVTNNSGVGGTIIVEIDYNRRDLADPDGKYSIGITKEYYIDSLYAWVDQDENDRYTAGEPLGFYHSVSEPERAKPIHARNYDITNINFTIP
jgi:hypothetical protein